MITSILFLTSISQADQVLNSCKAKGERNVFQEISLIKKADGLHVEFKDALKKAGFVTRDPRMVERKKYGKHGARRSGQYSKR